MAALVCCEGLRYELLGVLSHAIYHIPYTYTINLFLWEMQLEEPGINSGLGRRRELKWGDVPCACLINSTCTRDMHEREHSTKHKHKHTNTTLRVLAVNCKGPDEGEGDDSWFAHICHCAVI